MRTRRALYVAAAVAVTACLDSTLDPLPLDIGLQANRLTATTGDTINFLVTAQGGSLIGVEMDFADGNTDSYVAFGARTAHITFKHVYLSTGTFLVDAKVTDASAGSKNASIQVTVN